MIQAPSQRPESDRTTGGRRRRERARALLLAIVLSLIVYFFGRELGRHYAVEDWLFWKYAKAIGFVAFWSIATLVAGLGVVERFFPDLPLRERLVQAAACGVFTFYVLHFLGGLLQLFGPAWAVGLPAIMLASGTLASRRLLRRIWRHRKRFPRFTLGADRTWHIPIVLFGVACVFGLYLGILTPRNAAFDSVWYHLGLGQGWEAAGGIARSEEGWFVEGLPNLAAVLYSWGFLLPGLDLFETVMVAAHLELVLFLATLASLPVLVRWLLPQTRTGIAWVALFLFPSVFIYDASLHSGNDHIAAFWAVPIFLSLRRAWPRLDSGNVVLFALCCAGAILTKYQAASLVAAPALYLLGRSVYLSVRDKSSEPLWRGLGLGALAGLIFTAPLWVKNWAWYGDPLFPALHEYLTPRPWHDGMSAVMEQNWSKLVRRPEGTFVERLTETLRTGWTFSFRSFTGGRFHGKWPYFGSLFTLSVLWLPFVRGAKRTWALFVAAQIGVFVWFNLSHVERYLQALVPWMAAVVAAAVVLAWRAGWIVRAPVAALVLLQVLWGGDALFIRSHAMLRELPMVHSARLIESGFKGRMELRKQPFGTLEKIGDELPSDATVLLHGTNPRLGLKARVVTDKAGFQSGIRYGAMRSRREVYELYQRLGISHIAWHASKTRGRDTLAGDLRFFDFVLNEIDARRRTGSFEWGPLPPEPPNSEPLTKVLYLGCREPFRPGVYELEDLDVPFGGGRAIEPRAAVPSELSELLEIVDEVGAIVYGPRCKPRQSRPPMTGFRRATKKRGEELWVRKG